MTCARLLEIFDVSRRRFFEEGKKMGKQFIILLVAVPILAFVIEPGFAALHRYEIIDLGTLGGNLSGAKSINASGQIVGYTYNSSGYRRATLFDPMGNGNNLDLGTIGGSSSIAYSINNNGQIVGAAISNAEKWRATLFDESGSGNNINLGTLPGFQSSAALSINNIGQIVGWVYYGSAKSRAILFDPTGSGDNINLGSYRSWAYSINDRGQIVGATGGQATLFDASCSSNNIYLGSLPDFPTSHALSINNNGQIVGVVYDYDERFRATLFDSTGNGNNINLDTLGGYNSEARSINNNGKIVGSADLFNPSGDEDNVDMVTLRGYNIEEHSINNNSKIMGSAETTIYYRRATLFGLTGRGHNIDLNTLIDPNCGWTLAVAHSINDNDWIVGSGRNPVGHIHAFLMTPVLPTIEVPLKFTPQTLNCYSKGKWVKAHLVLPAEFTVEDVDSNSLTTGNPLWIEPNYTNISVNENELVEIEAAFERADFCGALRDNWHSEITICVRGSFISGQFFYGMDTIKIIDNSFKHLAILSSHWLESGCTKFDWCNGADIDQDSVVNFKDFALMAFHWLEDYSPNGRKACRFKLSMEKRGFQNKRE
jgi:probable HAF family extracellular repeat protein